VFAPSELRDLPDFDGQDGGSTLGGGCTEPRFADLAGLGKLVLSNIRTPKMLMDLTTGHGRAGGGGEGAAEAEEAQLKKSSGPTRPLEQVRSWAGLRCDDLAACTGHGGAGRPGADVDRKKLTETSFFRWLAVK